MSATNMFGDGRAERDHAMLDTSFLESQNYRILFESKDRFIVVGRRGTGKSALTYRLSKDWVARKSRVITIAPDEEQVIGIRPIAEFFGGSVNRIRAGIKLSWRYALLMEIALECRNHYKAAHEAQKFEKLSQHLNKWDSYGGNPLTRLRAKLKEIIHAADHPDDLIADLASILELNKITEEVATLTQSLSHGVVVLIDKLDEGYEPDIIGVGIVDGIIYGTDDVRERVKNVQALVFLRDNIFRAVQQEDRDFSRNLEGQILRLHWDPEELFYLVCKRVRTALSLELESDVKVWNAITCEELHGREGFKRCLRLTLYRPRDIISLLNTAIEQAKRQRREKLVQDDFAASSVQISNIRFDDLGKEYDSVFPGIKKITSAFSNGPSQLIVSDACAVIKRTLDSPDISADILQHLTILGTGEEVVKGLYGVGFWGVFDQQSNTWVFSHDGKQPNRSISQNDRLMVHPCYWAALNLQKEEMDQNVAEQIFDEYEITIHSQSSEQRATRLGQIISALNGIPLGPDGASEFEGWCKQVIEIAFAKELTNVVLHPNKSAVQRRDIVATNQGQRGFWKRIREDYETRQVIFEVKNFEDIGIEEYRQMNGYLAREYGRLGFIICRDKQPGLMKGKELEAFKEFYIQGKVIIKITASTLTKILSKLRSPAKIDAGDLALDSQLDTHIRLYSTGQSDSGVRRKAKRMKSKLS